VTNGARVRMRNRSNNNSRNNEMGIIRYVAVGTTTVSSIVGQELSPVMLIAHLVGRRQQTDRQTEGAARCFSLKLGREEHKNTPASITETFRPHIHCSFLFGIEPLQTTQTCNLISSYGTLYTL
jgi:hypothetical protein